MNDFQLHFRKNVHYCRFFQGKMTFVVEIRHQKKGEMLPCKSDVMYQTLMLLVKQYTIINLVKLLLSSAE